MPFFVNAFVSKNNQQKKDAKMTPFRGNFKKDAKVFFISNIPFRMEGHFALVCTNC